jgi:nucleoside-diphosphate-sugar epimerase
VRASLSILADFAKYGGKRVTIAGTCAEYDWNYGFCSEGITPVKPRGVYGVCKNALMQIAGSFCRQNGISYAWGRLFFLFGPGEYSHRLVPSIILGLLRTKEIPCTDGLQVRDFLFSAEAASAIARLLLSGAEGPVNIASGNPVSVRELATRIGEKIGNKELIRFGRIPRDPNEPDFVVADTKKLHSEVGWTSKVGLDEALDRTIEWWKKNPLLNEN